MPKRTVIIDNKITCKKCGETKELMYFCQRPEHNSYRGTCKMCSKGYNESLFKKQQDIMMWFSQGMKECSHCKRIKILEDFHIDRNTKFGYATRCRECLKVLNKRTYEKNRLKSAYNMTIEDYHNMLYNQNHQCAICYNNLQAEEVRTHIDHCHITGKVRGVLCNLCNGGLGFFRDSIENLESAIEYLKNSRNDT